MTHLERALALAAAAVVFVTWLTWGPTISRTIRGHHKGARP